MKKYIEKIRAKGKEHTNRMSIIFAAITTIGVVIIWLVLLSVFKTQVEVPEIDTSGDTPGVQEFLQEAQEQFKSIGNALEENNQNFQELIEEAESEIDAKESDLETTEGIQETETETEN